jgi:hypothetical protein
MAAESKGLTLTYLKEVFVSAALRRANEGVALMDDAFLDAALEAAGELRTHLRRVRDPDSLAEMRPGREILGFR